MSMIVIRSRWVVASTTAVFVIGGFVPRARPLARRSRNACRRSRPDRRSSSRGRARPVLEVPASRCGELVVPENRSKSNGKTIRLPGAIIPAASGTPAPAPLLWIDGGPGGDPCPPLRDLVEFGLNRDRDLVLMGLRGTYSARPRLVCPEIDDYRANSLARKFTAPATSKAAVAAAAGCARADCGRRASTSPRTTRPRRHRTSPSCGRPWASTSGTCSRTPTAPMWRSPTCGDTPRASAPWSSTAPCRPQPRSGLDVDELPGVLRQRPGGLRRRPDL